MEFFLSLFVIMGENFTFNYCPNFLTRLQLCIQTSGEHLDLYLFLISLPFKTS